MLYNMISILIENLSHVTFIKHVSQVKILLNIALSFLSFVLMAYYKDIFFALSTVFIEASLLVHDEFEFSSGNSSVIGSISVIIFSIILTVWRYGKRTFGIQKIDLAMD